MGISLALKNNWMRRFSVLFAIMVGALCVWLDLLDRQRHSYATSAAGIHLERPDGHITGLPPLDGIRSSVVYHANSQTGFYNHHTHIIRHRNNFFVAWSNHPSDEDERGQRVLLSRSQSGHSWNAPIVLFPPVKSGTGQELVLTANGWLVFDDVLYAIADLHDNLGWTDNEGFVIAKQQSALYNRTAQRSMGRLGRRVNDDGTLGAPFWLARAEALDTVCPNCQPQTELAGALNAMLQEPLNRRHWQLIDGNLKGYWVDRYPIKSDDGHHLAEPTTYLAQGGLLVRLFRDLDLSHYLYATTSSNGGKSWSQPSRTDIPDSPSLSSAGELPDGRRYILGNPVPGSRDPLAIRFSEDGVRFGAAQLIRGGAPALRLPGKYKGPGFQYPAAVVADNALWVVYSVNKEDIEVSRVALSPSPKVRR